MSLLYLCGVVLQMLCMLAKSLKPRDLLRLSVKIHISKLKKCFNMHAYLFASVVKHPYSAMSLTLELMS